MWQQRSALKSTIQSWALPKGLIPTKLATAACGIAEQSLAWGPTKSSDRGQSYPLSGHRFHPPDSCVVSQASMALWRNIWLMTG